MVILDRIRELLATCSEATPFFPPTTLYNEGWMLRLVLDWFAQQGDKMAGHPLAVPFGCRWYSEALLASQFKPSDRGEKLGEGYTHADGVIGHFDFSGSGDGDIRLTPEATCFKVVEAKMYSRLSRGTTYAPGYDQAARNVACMAEVVRLSGTPVEHLDSLAFIVLVPEDHPDMADFRQKVAEGSIRDRVQARVMQYTGPSRGERLRWFEDSFVPVLAKTQLAVVHWEQVLAGIEAEGDGDRHPVRGFYECCLRFNRKRGPTG